MRDENASTYQIRNGFAVQTRSPEVHPTNTPSLRNGFRTKSSDDENVRVLYRWTEPQFNGIVIANGSAKQIFASERHRIVRTCDDGDDGFWHGSWGLGGNHQKTVVTTTHVILELPLCLNPEDSRIQNGRGSAEGRNQSGVSRIVGGRAGGGPAANGVAVECVEKLEIRGQLSHLFQ